MTGNEFFITPGLQEDMEKFCIMVEEVSALKASLKKPIIILGPTGTGKSSFVDVFINIHKKKHGDKNVVSINCAEYEGDFARAELFGREKGAYTGSDTTKEGLLKEADGGILILEEIGELTKDVQAKLLIALEKGEYFRLGGTTKKKIKNLAIVATTNREQASFREDFWFRCIPFSIPPISSRRKDILYYLNLNHPEALRSLDQWELLRVLLYNWPGNFREIDNINLAININRKVIGNDKDRILPELSAKIDNDAINEIWSAMLGSFVEKEELFKIRDYFLKFNLEINGNNKEKKSLPKIPKSKFYTDSLSGLKVLEENKLLENIYLGFKNWCTLFAIHWKSKDDCLYRAHRHQFDFFPIDGPDREFLIHKNWHKMIAYRDAFYPEKEDEKKVFFSSIPKLLDKISKNLTLISEQIQPKQEDPQEEQLKIEKALSANGGVMSKAARSLEIPITTFRRKVDEYGLRSLTKSFKNKKAEKK